MNRLRAALPTALVALLVAFFVPSPEAGRAVAASGGPAGKSETAVLAGGCFWGMESVFEHVRGVTNVVSGFSGGSKETAHYDDVSEGDTGHAESVEITYDPTRISYATLLDVYFRVAHDPTELNEQGPDSGSQYRSVIFYASPAQKRIAETEIATLTGQKAFSAPIVTQVVPLRGFYPAEAYHQHFAALHPLYPYIVINDAPKLVQLRDLFPKLAD
jgi:peptide-methionine (S)-S-oxide reductase